MKERSSVKKYYLDVLKKALGIDSSEIKGNDVYRPSKQNIDKINNIHKNTMHTNYHINISVDEMSIPQLFWMPKLL